MDEKEHIQFRGSIDTKAHRRLKLLKMAMGYDTLDEAVDHFIMNPLDAQDRIKGVEEALS